MGAENRDFSKVAVVGAGAWGTTLAHVLAEKGLSVRLWAYESEVADTINRKQENLVFLPGVKLSGGIRATHSLTEAVDGRGFLVFAVPSQVARSVLDALAPLLDGVAPPVVSATKGIEEESLDLMTRVIEGTLPARSQVAVLSGPSFAAEVVRGLPTAVTLAGADDHLIQSLQRTLMTPAFRVYTTNDVVGVQLGGALKNVMALAAGVVDGLGLGHNTRAALITRGLAEMIRLGIAMGADPRTFFGLSGAGDLVLTCTGALSRNHSVGARLGRGENLRDILAGMQAVAEGVRTSKAALKLAERHRVDMPIVKEVCAVLFEGKACGQAVRDLMERDAKEETSGL